MQSVSGARAPVVAAPKRGELQRCGASMKSVRDRIGSVQKTKKITEAMKLVAAAKVRKAQEAVVQGRPFAENLIKVLYGVNQKLQGEDIDSPLARTRPVKVVTVCCVTGDRGLCGGYNSFVIKQAAARVQELQQQDPPIDVRVVSIGAKGTGFFKRRPETFNMIKEFSIGQNPTSKEAQGIADELFTEFVSEEVDKVELVYTKFQSLIKSDPVVQSLLPLLPAGEMCDIDGNCIDPAHDELFKLTTKDGKLTLEREPVDVETKPFDDSIIFEQEPSEILDALLPLYLNAVILRALQEAVASELAARMNAMSNASDNADSLKKELNTQYNRMRQASITGQILEICGGADAVN